MSVGRLVEQAREWGLRPRANFRELIPLVAGLADAVEQLQADYAEANRAALAWQSGSRQAFSERDEARDRVAALEAAMRAHDECRVCRELLGLVPSTGQETT